MEERDKDFILELLKRGGANREEKQKIFELYKKYIDPTHLTYQDSPCSSCTSSILRMWNKLKELL